MTKSSTTLPHWALLQPEEFDSSRMVKMA